jgi:uncharacterized protein (DUF1684 family)
MLLRVAPFLIAVLAVAAPPDAYRQEIEQWRKGRETRLAAEGGWLSVAGLDWLSEGENRFGSDPKNAVVFPPGKGPAVAGVLLLAGGKVTLKPEPGAGITLDGQPASERQLRVDADGKPDVLRLGSLAFHIIKRGDRFAVRLKDSERPERIAFKGVPAFPVQASYKVEGTFIPYDPPKEIPIATVIGTVEPMNCPGKVVFRLGGRQVSLEPVLEPGSPELFFIFRDRTSGKQTYPAGRFLYAAPAKDGKVVLDFNKAVNPPCAFTEFATCPLPPRQNALPVPVRAGEKTYGSH